jgi:uncharacterized membrane protein
MNKTLSDQIAENPTQFNIAAIAKLEEEALDRRTRTERQSDAVVRFIGSPKFLLLHVILVVLCARSTGIPYQALEEEREDDWCEMLIA